MTPDQEKQLLAGLYDRLFDAITYSPGGKSAVFDKATTFFQFSKNEALNEKDFANAATPSNPGGDLNTAEQFFRMVDAVPAVQADYAPSTTTLSTVYQSIVNGANSKVEPDSAQQAIYEKAYGYLNSTTTIKDFTGKETTQSGPSNIYATYQNNQTAYITAVTAYRNAYLGYDLTKQTDQRAWQSNEPMLQNAVGQTWNTWRGQGAAQVEQALAAINTSVNSAVRSSLLAAQAAVASQNQMASSLGVNAPWFMSYALPTNWYDPTAGNNFTNFTLSSANLKTSASSNFTSYGGGASWSAGLWSVGAKVGGSSGSTNFHMDAQNVSLSAKLGLVRIFRPWLHGFIFNMTNWFLDSAKKNGISNGQLKGNENGLLSLIPTAFVVMRDVKISADFSTQDTSHVESAISTSASVGWGPFSISGNYSHSSSSDAFSSTLDKGTITVPGMQIVGWLSQIVPASPPQE